MLMLYPWKVVVKIKYMEITKEQYSEALDIVNQYRVQLRSSYNGDNANLDVYELVRSEMMANHDITLKEFEDLVDMWVRIKEKEISIKKLQIE